MHSPKGLSTSPLATIIHPNTAAKHANKITIPSFRNSLLSIWFLNKINKWYHKNKTHESCPQSGYIPKRK